jgi:outer membrane receptor for ferrienterochelin and colicins
MKSLFHLFFIILFCGSVSAQTLISGIVYDANKKPIPGAIVYFPGKKMGTSTDTLGRFSLLKPDSVHLLIADMLYYYADTIDLDKETPTFYLKDKTIELRESIFYGEDEAHRYSVLNPQLVEELNEREFLKAACCNLSESFSTNATVDVNYSDAVTGAKSIQMLGLDGRYVQITTELLPSIRGLASPFGLSYIPGTWLESLQISKGAGSVVNGYEAMTGQINLELRKPYAADRLLLNVYVNHMGRVEGNANLSFRIGKRWSNITLLHGDYFNTITDMNNDGFLDMPLIKTESFVHRWQYFGKRIETQFGVKGLHELRNGGTSAFYRQDSLAPQYGVQMTTWRGEGFAKFGIVFPETEWRSIGMQANFVYHNQYGFIGLNGYTGIQKSGFFNFIYQSIFGNTKHKFRTGASFMYDDYNETYSNINLKRTELVPGGFFEYTLDNLKGITVVAGGRLDYHNLFGLMPSPRMHLKWEITKGLLFRIAGGRGWRVPNVFADNISMLVTSRNIQINNNIIQPEIAWNYGASLQYVFKINKRDATLVADFFRTDFSNQLIINREAENMLVFSTLSGPSFSNVFQFNFNMEPIKKFDIRVAYKFQDVRATYNGMLKTVPLVPMHRVLLNLGYTTPQYGFSFDFTTHFTGNSRMPSITDPNFSSLNGATPWYVILNAQITKSFKILDVYFGCENITNYTQHVPLVDAGNPFGNKFDATLVYAPIFGRMFYGGIRLKIEYKQKKKQ